METILTLLGLVFVFVIGRFVWDTFVTGKTERDWQDYKHRYPAEAERVERNRGLDFGSRPANPTLASKPGDLKGRLPNFMKMYADLDPRLRAEVSANDASRFEFRMPISTYGNIMGHNHVGVHDRGGEYEMYIYALSRRGKKVQGTRISFLDDLPAAEYEENMDQLARSLAGNPEYLEIAIGST